VIATVLAEFADAARASFAEQGFAEAPVFAPSVDLRYVGQSYEVNVPVGPDLEAAFHRRHEALFGHAARGEPVELVTVRFTATIPRVRHVPRHHAQGVAIKGARKVLFAEGRQSVSVYDRGALAEGFRTSGPAVIEEEHATTVVPPWADARVLAHGILAVEVPP
jgi:N-methylhydantoinase A